MRIGKMLGVLMAAAVAAPALGDLIGPAFRIHASSPAGEGVFEVPQSWGQWNNGVWTWTATQPYAVPNQAGGPALAVLSSCSITYIQDPVVSLAFGVMAGSSTTTFTISSALLSFAPISPATGNASAGLTFTDVDGNGAAFTALHPGPFAYRSQYNGLVPAGTDFASFIASQTTGAFGTGIDSGNQPPIGIGPAVTSMSAQWRFSLTANDTAGGTSVFNIVPAPGAVVLLGLGGVLAMRRRR